MGSKSRIFHPIEAVTLEHLVPVDHVYRQLERTGKLKRMRCAGELARLGS